MGGHGLCIEVAGEAEFLERLDGLFLDDGDDVLFLALAREAVAIGDAADLGVRLALGAVGLADFLEVEGDFVFPQVACEGDAVAVGDGAAGAGLADGDGAVSGDLAEEFVAALDLKFVKAGQQGAEADEHEDRQQVEPDAVSWFHGIRRCGGGVSRPRG